MAILTILVLASKLVLFFSNFSAATDTITQFDSLEDNKTLVSKDGTFELGFFTPDTTSSNRYLGIWYANIPVRTVVWVANRDTPITDNSTKLIINTEGNLVLLSNNNTVIWSTNTTTTKGVVLVAQILDSGNFVLRVDKDTNPENYSWQSFDYPSDTFLPGMKIGWDLKKGNRGLTSWRNWFDPSPGDFRGAISRTNNPEEIMWKGSTKYFRSGPWDGTKFSGSPYVSSNSVVKYTVVLNNDEFYATYSISDKSVISRIVMNRTLLVRELLTWSKDSQTWTVSAELPGDLCDGYNTCGAFGICDVSEAPICRCLDGFKPKALQNWTQMNFNQGCVHNQTWSCGEKNKDGFLRFSKLKLPDTTTSWVNASMTLEECKNKCRENCSCTAYANSDIRGNGSGCAIWFGDLLDMRIMPSAGQDLYIRLAVSETGQENQDYQKDNSKRKVVVIASTISSVIVMLLIFIFIYWNSKTKIKEIITRFKRMRNESQQEDFELPLFDLASIEYATNYFSNHNKLGEGGFGPVYKGTLQDGREIAVKRLSETSAQGLKEFKNEVTLCAELQHRNLVKVLGCCIQHNEKLLLYEYMANKSLDFFIFDSSRRKLLDWPKRLCIINGIARGVLYLHQDSRLRIIHRDLKASNVLLDNAMNPKISDFGLARMCGGDQIEGQTKKIVGTYGYMAPEYAFDGIFSTKSDVFSFGVLLLEIISGKKNRLFYPNDYNNLIWHAWKLWKEGNAKQFIDSSLEDSSILLEDSSILYEALRCIHIGLLCVQHHPNDRPDMSFVVTLLNNENALPLPKEPSYLINDMPARRGSSKNLTSYSVNDVTISMLSDR